MEEQNEVDEETLRVTITVSRVRAQCKPEL